MTIKDRVNEHLKEGFEYFSESRVIGIFLQGSQNYNLEVEGSDVDTKLIVVPTFKEIAFNKKPHSTTHVRANDEHIDFKDIRLMINCFRKQNINFVEILFTEYKWENPLYQEQWDRLTRKREAIARYSPYAAVKTMKGVALEKFHAMEHKYPAKLSILEKYGYDPKQLHHLLRVKEFLKRYISGEPYEECLKPHCQDYLKAVKLGLWNLEEAREIAKKEVACVISIADTFCDKIGSTSDSHVDWLLDDVQYNIMKIAVESELNVN